MVIWVTIRDPIYPAVFGVASVNEVCLCSFNKYRDNLWWRIQSECMNIMLLTLHSINAIQYHLVKSGQYADWNYALLSNGIADISNLQIVMRKQPTHYTMFKLWTFHQPKSSPSPINQFFSWHFGKLTYPPSFYFPCHHSHCLAIFP